MIDDIDRRILQLLQDDARTSNAAIARDVGLAPSAVFQRIRKLENEGIIQGYHARLDPTAIGQGLLAFVSVQTGKGARARETADMLAGIPEVLEVHRVVGDDCFFLKIRVRDTSALGALLDEKIQRLPPVASTRTTIVLSTAKQSEPALGDSETDETSPERDQKAS
ncbi:MAG TPA: Lrp/AsnC family transcriptional regulator [Longimicrobiales bacterium]|nr:Lrp/AsnC family transcriptional regulator [Longimicrobiales bacterium]